MKAIKSKATRYDREFKLGAVKMVTEEGKKISEVANNLGISDPTLRQWIKAAQKDKQDAFPGSGKQTPQDEEVNRLREENCLLRMERDLIEKL